MLKLLTSVQFNVLLEMNLPFIYLFMYLFMFSFTLVVDLCISTYLLSYSYKNHCAKMPARAQTLAHAWK